MTIEAIEVGAPRAQVSGILAAHLSPEDLAMLRISVPTVDPFAPEPHRDLPTIQTLIEFTAGAIASGITYDVLKRAAIVLREKLGAAQVREIDSESGEAENVAENETTDGDGEQ